MGLRFRTLLAGGVIVVLLITSTFIALSAILSNGYYALEHKQSESNAQRVVKALDYQLESQLASTADYAEWDDTYDFVNTHDPTYLEENYDLTVYSNLDISMLLILDLQHNIVFGQAFDLETGQEALIPDSILPYLQEGQPLVSLVDPDSTLDGYLVLPEGPLMVSANPILENNGVGEPQGVLIMGRWLDDAVVENISERTNLNFRVYLLGKDNPPANMDSIQADLGSTQKTDGFPYAFQVQDEDIAHAYTELTDLNNAPAVLVEVEIPRDIYHQGRDSLTLMMIVLILIGVTFSPIMAFLLEAHVLRRIIHLSRGVSEIAETGDLAKVLPEKGNDEVSDLTSNFNHLLSTLARTQNELKEAKEAAENANRAKDMFVAQVSHELRTPLSAILGYTELLNNEVIGPLLPQQKKATSQVLDSTRHLTGLVNDLLDQAQMERGTFRMHYGPCEPRLMADQVITELMPQADHKGLKLTQEIAPDVPQTLEGDNRRLIQIMTNLVTNAVKFTDKGEINFRIFCPGQEHWAIQVKDTGPGIPSEARQIIFEPFKQVDNTITRRQRGYGLGLTIVKRLSVQMGGEIYLESELGKGSTFTVLLPMHPPTQE